jgi:hypothetical protein
VIGFPPVDCVEGRVGVGVGWDRGEEQLQFGGRRHGDLPSCFFLLNADRFGFSVEVDRGDAHAVAAPEASVRG